MILLAGCLVSDPPPSTSDSADDRPELSLSLGAVQTVITATWSTETATTSEVVASFGDEQLRFEETEPTTHHVVEMVGFPSLSDVEVTVGDGPSASITTGHLPAWVPDLTYEASAPEASEGGLTLLPIITLSSSGAVMVDSKGRVVWSFPPQDVGTDLFFRMRMAADGHHVLIDSQSASAELPGTVVAISMDGSDIHQVDVVGGHTDFVEYTPGGYASIAWDLREIEGRKILGDTIVEIAPDGAAREVWNVWDWFEPDLSVTWPSFYPADPEVEGWSHINGLTYDPIEDAYYITMTFNSGVAKIDRASGDLLWWIGSDAGADIQLPAGTIVYPHSVQLLEDGLLVFSRGNYYDSTAYSEVVELDLEEAAGRAEGRWSYSAPDRLLVPSLGSAQRLDRGNTLVSWSTAGRVVEVTPDGTVAWQVSTAIGSAFGFAERIPAFAVGSSVP